jgi:type III secretion HrpO family protein
MQTSQLLEFAQRGLLLALWVSLPVVVAAVLVGLLFAVLQATTQIQDQTTSTILKLIAACVVLALTANWVGSNVRAFTDEMWRTGGFPSATPKI